MYFNSETNKSYKPGLFVLILLALTAFKFFSDDYKLFISSIESVYKINLNDSKENIIYKLGKPSEVYENGWVFHVDGNTVYQITSTKETNDIIKKISTKRVDDFDHWKFIGIYGENDLLLKFNTNGFTQSIKVTSLKNIIPFSNVAGIQFGDTEEKIVNIGYNSKSEIVNFQKYIYFYDLGLSVTLSKGKVTELEIKNVEHDFVKTFKCYWLYKFAN